MTAELNAEDVGLAAVTTSELSVEHAEKVAAVLDAHEDVSVGNALPLLWHWAFFTAAVATRALGHDGHPPLPTDGPTAGLPRRMWAGGRVRANGPLLIGQPATRRSHVTKAERKSGRSGELLVVTATHEVEQGGRVVIAEEQDLVYRAASGAPVDAPVGAVQPDAPEGGWSDVVTVDPVTLFRFSAVTFNGHRIHYDLPYATDAEGYPGLVVQGPLAAILLAESARRRGWHGSSFAFRATAPLFAQTPFTLLGAPDSHVGDVSLQAFRSDGVAAMSARLA